MGHTKKRLIRKRAARCVVSALYENDSCLTYDALFTMFRTKPCYDRHHDHILSNSNLKKVNKTHLVCGSMRALITIGCVQRTGQYIIHTPTKYWVGIKHVKGKLWRFQPKN